MVRSLSAGRWCVVSQVRRKRRRLGEARTHRVVVKVSERERDRLEILAGERGVSVQSVLMSSALSGGSEAAMRLGILSDELAMAVRLQSRLGSLLNQLVAHAHATGDLADEVSVVVKKLGAVGERLDAVAAELEARR